MGRYEESLAGGSQALHVSNDLIRGLPVKTRGRFINEQDRRSCEERPSKPDSLLLARGQLSGKMLDTSAQLEHAEKFHASVIAILDRSPVKPWQGDVLLRSQLWEESGPLKNVTDEESAQTGDLRW